MMSSPNRLLAKNIYFTDQNGPKRELHENEVLVSLNSEMNVTNKKQKVDERME